MAMKNALVMSSRLSQLQNIDGMSMKGHPTPRAFGERKDERMPNATAGFFNNLKSICIALSPLSNPFRIPHWRNFCFDLRQLSTHSASAQKSAILRPHGDFNDSGQGDDNAW
jgi:hypothetical protein